MYVFCDVLITAFQHPAFEQFSMILTEVSISIIVRRTRRRNPNLEIERVCFVGIAGGASCDTSIERIMLSSPTWGWPASSLFVPRQAKATKNCTDERHIYLRGRLCGEAMQEEKFEPTKSNDAIDRSPSEAAMRFEEAQMIR
jgi:hypothetical protein